MLNKEFIAFYFKLFLNLIGFAIGHRHESQKLFMFKLRKFMNMKLYDDTSQQACIVEITSTSQALIFS